MVEKAYFSKEHMRVSPSNPMTSGVLVVGQVINLSAEAQNKTGYSGLSGWWSQEGDGVCGKRRDRN